MTKKPKNEPQLLTVDEWDQWLTKLEGLPRERLEASYVRAWPGERQDIHRLTVRDLRRGLIVGHLIQLGLVRD